MENDILDVDLVKSCSLQWTLIIVAIFNWHSSFCFVFFHLSLTKSRFLISSSSRASCVSLRLFPGCLSLPQINSFVCSSNTSQCFHLSLSAGSELDNLSWAVVMLWIKKAKLNCLIGFLGKGKTDLNWLPVMAFCGTTLASAVWGGFSKTN